LDNLVFSSITRTTKNCNSMESEKPANAENSRRPKRQIKRDGNKSVVITHPAMNCVICADENVKYAATGSCDHPICSLCSLRIRVKSLDTCCPLCKQVMDIVVVYPIKLTGQKPFASFGIWGIDSPAPGLDIDHRAGIVFADCKDHFREMDKIRSIVCPLKKCNLRFPSQDVLLKHLNTAHPGQNLCILCLKNRPLFISEHSLMTTGELKKHMSAPPGALTGAGGDKTAGHPLCLFCSEHFFDSQALYIHMKQEHQSCHLCPTSYQFRFYPTIDELRTHLHDEHFVCNLCEKASANGDEGPGVFGSSFRNHGEYSSHMQSFHGVRNASVSLGFRVGYNDNGDGNAGRHGGKQGQNRRAAPRNQLQFLDLDMASADPNRNTSSQHSHRNAQGSGQSRQSAATVSSEPREQNSVSTSAVGPQIESAMAIEARRRQLFHLQTSAAIAATPLVPAHMRVAGRVVAGRFQRDSEDDVIQRAADEQALLASATHGTTHNRAPGTWTERSRNSSSMNMAFPALSSSATTAARPKQNEDDQSLKGPAPAPHPLSLIGGIQREAAARRALEEEKKAIEAELEDRRARRNEMMAGALGVGQHSSSATALAGDPGVTLDPTVLRKVLYPPTLLNWARNNKLELQKLEKKMLDLIADKKSNSAQLKPMGASSRNAVHGLSRYYSLNSYEYDPEPRRYVSLVKSADSIAPSVRLSAASTAPLLPPVSMLTALCEPSLYITLSNPTSGYFPTDAINETRGRQKASEISTNLSLGGHVTVGDVVGRVKAVIKAQLAERHPFSPPQSYRITGVKTAGASSVSRIPLFIRRY
jgi:R3H domain